MSFTSVPGAQDALLAAVQARAALPGNPLEGALIQLGLPTEVPTETERVYIDDMSDLDRVRRAEQDIYGESFLLPVIIEVRSFGRDTRAACRARAYEMLDELDAALVADRELGTAAADSDLESVPRQVTQPLPDGWLTKILANVRVLSIV